MSKIDWQKPLQLTKSPWGQEASPRKRMAVVKEDGGNRLIVWDGDWGQVTAMVSEMGGLIATLHCGAALKLGSPFVENVPEVVVEPKEWMVLFCAPGGRWRCYSGEPRTATDAVAEEQKCLRTSPCRTAKVVKVGDDKPTMSVQSIAQHVENVTRTEAAVRNSLLATSIKYVRQWAVLQRPPHKLGCEAVADMYERGCKAAERELAYQDAKKDPGK